MATIHVQVREDKRNGKVVLWEKHTRHPGGECFIAGDERTYAVGRSPGVGELIARGELVEVDAPADVPADEGGAPKPRSRKAAQQPADDGANAGGGGQSDQGGGAS